MKKFFLVVMSLVLAMFSTGVFAADPCPQGASCSENYILTGTAAQTTTPPPVEKVVEARSRILDKTRVFQETSSVCIYSQLDYKLEAWLEERPEVVVERKEFLAPAYKQKHAGSAFSNECTTTLVVHYRKK
jgi:hypothetical protein